MSEHGDLQGYELQEAANALCRRPGDAEMPMPPKERSQASEDGRAGASRYWQEVNRSNEDRMVAFVRAHPGCTRAEISRGLGLPYESARSMAGRLVARGQLATVSPGTAGRGHVTTYCEGEGSA